jgi:hypothetical protein
VADGLSSDLDRAMSDRTKRLGRLGNAVVPQVAEWLGERLIEYEQISGDRYVGRRPALNAGSQR